MEFTKAEISRLICSMDNTSIKLPSQTRARLMITDEEFRELYKSNGDFKKTYDNMIRYQESEFLSKIIDNLSSSEFNHKQAQYILDHEFGWNSKKELIDTSELSDEDRNTIEKANSIMESLREKYERDY